MVRLIVEMSEGAELLRLIYTVLQVRAVWILALAQ